MIDLLIDGERVCGWEDEVVNDYIQRPTTRLIKMTNGTILFDRNLLSHFTNRDKNEWLLLNSMGNQVRVGFYKNDGSYRSMVCRLDKKPDEFDKYFVVWSINDEGPKSIGRDKIVYITFL